MISVNDGGLTWEVTTLLKMTKMTVWKNIVPSIPIAFGSLKPDRVTSVVCGRKDVKG